MPERQFSSCDPCRKARIGCDANRKTPGSCSNCIRRKLKCMSARRGIRQSQLANNAPAIPSSTRSNTDIRLQTDLDRRQNALSFHTLLWDIFATQFEPQLGLWIGNDCCPFKSLPTAPKTLITRLMMTLDEGNRQFCQSSETRSMVSNAEDNALINKALVYAVYAFSVRWVITRPPKIDSNFYADITQEAQDRLSDVLWHRARENMYPLLGRPSYRSSLALYLFGITPVTSQNSEFRFSDVCLATSLMQLKELRLGDLNRSSYDWSCRNSAEPSSGARSAEFDSQHSHMENTAYWFGIVSDVSRCLLSGKASVLSLDSTINPPIWQLVGEQLDEFRANYGNLHRSQLPLPEETVFKVLSHASASKTLCWWRIVEVRNATFREETLVSIKEAVALCLEEIGRFENIFLPFINLFIRDFMFIKDELQIGVFLLTLHFHLGVLTFLDVIHQIPNLRDILPNYSILLLSSTRELNNLIRVVISPTGAQPNGNILLLDPYPEHISRALWYAGRAILELGKEFTFSPLSVEAMFAVPLTGLSMLQKVSFSSRERLRALQQLHSSPDVVNAVNNPSSPTMFPSPVSMSSRSIGLESAEHLADEIATYPNLINDSVERRERALGIDQNASFSEIDLSFIGELDLNQFDMLIGQWEFMDCFAQV